MEKNSASLTPANELRERLPVNRNESRQSRSIVKRTSPPWSTIRFTSALIRITLVMSEPRLNLGTSKYDVAVSALIAFKWRYDESPIDALCCFALASCRYDGANNCG